MTQTLTGSEKAVVTAAVSVPDKHCVNCRLVAEQRVAPGCLCAVYVQPALVWAGGGWEEEKKKKTFMVFTTRVMQILRVSAFSKEVVEASTRHTVDS